MLQGDRRDRGHAGTRAGTEQVSLVYTRIGELGSCELQAGIYAHVSKLEAERRVIMYTVVITFRTTKEVYKEWETSNYYAALAWAGSFNEQIYIVEIFEW